jgi:hypothetical protein
MPATRRDPGAPGQRTGPAGGRAPARPDFNVQPSQPKDKPGLTTGAAFNQYVNAHPGLRPFADLIWATARRYGVDPVYMAALFFTEAPKNKDGTLNPSGTGGTGGRMVGLAQINPDAWIGKRGPNGKIITQKDLLNPQFQIEFATWLISRGLQAGQTYADVYLRTYNPNDPNNVAANPYAKLPKNYVFHGWAAGKPAPPPGTQGAVEDAAAAKAAREDPWVYVDKKGRVRFWAHPEPPKNALKVDGLPITRSSFLRARRELEELYISYTGKRPTNEQIAKALANGWSLYTITVGLSKTKDFYSSPIWKQKAPGYRAAAEGLLGEGEKLDNELVRQAIVNNWEGDSWQSILRKRQGYVTSQEARGKYATFRTVHESIYGKLSEEDERRVQEAALSGWTLDQYAAWLRGQEAYTGSPEYNAKMLTFMDALGFITGQTPVLTMGGRRSTNPNPGGGLFPDDPRIPGWGGQADPQFPEFAPGWAR